MSLNTRFYDAMGVLQGSKPSATADCYVRFDRNGCSRRTHSRSQQRTGSRVLQTHPEKQDASGRDRDMPEPEWRGRAAACSRAVPGQSDGAPAARGQRGGRPLRCGSR